MPINPALMRPGRLIVDVTFAMRPSPPQSADEPVAVLVAAHADAIMAAQKTLERLASADFVIEDVTDDVAPGYLPEFVHYAASAQCDDILSALAALDSEGLSHNRVQYVTDAGDYNVADDQF